MMTGFLSGDMAGMDTFAPPMEIDPMAPEETGLQVLLDDGAGGYLNGEILDPAPAEPEHGDNLADWLDEEELTTIGTTLVDLFEQDKASRKKWEDTLKKGMDLLGLQLDEGEQLFDGACLAHHPVLLEAGLQFQGRAMGELFPADGPVKTKTLGQVTNELMGQAARVREFMNYQITEEMEEYREDHDQMLFMLPFSGSCFKKVYWDAALGRPVSVFITADDFVVSYTTRNLLTSPRYTHVIPMLANELKKKIALGEYRTIEVPEPNFRTAEGIKETTDKIEGRDNPGHADRMDGVHHILEMHVEWDLKSFPDTMLDEDGYETETGIALPYVIAVDRDSGKVLSIKRNWREGDHLKRKQGWFVHYKFLPGPGFYGLSLIHLLGNLQMTATALLRSLVDSGQFANLPGGFMGKGVSMSKGTKIVGFGEWIEVDGYADDLSKALFPNPTREPSQTLFLLLGSIVEDARRLGAIADMSVGEGNQEAPVGTTLALLEAGGKLMSAIHARLHAAQRQEFKLLARVNGDNIEAYREFQVEDATLFIQAADFDSRVDVLPVSDPNVSSETQRMAQGQAKLQLAQQFPQFHDMREALVDMHTIIGTKNIAKILPPPRGPKYMDPATENYAVTQGRPVKAYAQQNHEAHIAVHQMELQKLMQAAAQNPVAAQAVQLLMAHIAEHQAHLARQQIEAAAGIQLPVAPDYDPTNPLKEDGYEITPEMENAISQALGMAAQQLQQLQQQAAAAQQQQAAQADPMYQLQVQKLGIDAQAVQQKAEAAQTQAALKSRELDLKEADQERDRKLAGHKIVVDAQLQREQMEQATEAARINAAGRQGGRSPGPREPRK